MSPVQDMMSRLNSRRKELGMSYSVVARRADVSQRTVQRLLSGEADDVRLGTLAAIADVLEAKIEIRCPCGSRTIRRRQARRKAEELVALAQGSAALEGQAVRKKELDKLTGDLTDEIAVGSDLRLWSEP